ncbi:elongation of very long chain fatty acids protein 6 [Cimex lectularius]|uniref:Elongation of very long chain fatty acids protein n=1 Tax=Cimex lectularius TaxID=79782 RepID=A0A8I6RRE2_CIMLE|nr:elongation of very long chain fatty acids protein 6 [Cimex lectularius]
MRAGFSDMVTNRNYSYIFHFEEEFSNQETRAWMTKNWTISFYISGLYMILIFGIQYFMQSRRPFKLEGLLCLWNSLLAAFSIMGAYRTAPELLYVLKNYGLYQSICVPSFIEQDQVAGVWTWLFVLSKLPELGDTIFIVLRKKPLIFLHWYHHITVLIYAWFSYTEYTASARWFIVMNYCVHSIMYTYYALRSMGYSPPKRFAMVITGCQLAQMVIATTVNVWAAQYIQQRQPCNVTSTNLRMSITMYLSYFVLFARFFYKAYMSPRSHRKGAVSMTGGFSSNTADKIKCQ